MRASAFLLLLLVASTSHAPPYHSDFDVNLNPVLTEPSYSGCADPAYEWIDSVTCRDLASESVAGTAFLWIVSSRRYGFPEGIGGIQFGIEYDGIDIESWTLCTGGMQIPEPAWPRSGTGNAATWARGCYYSPGEVARVGFFTLPDGTSGEFHIEDDPRVRQILYADCLYDLFKTCTHNAGGGTLPQLWPVCENNCTVPVRETTWSHLKYSFSP